jgi:hypothetical protein
LLGHELGGASSATRWRGLAEPLDEDETAKEVSIRHEVTAQLTDELGAIAGVTDPDGVLAALRVAARPAPILGAAARRGWREVGDRVEQLLGAGGSGAAIRSAVGRSSTSSPSANTAVRSHSAPQPLC